MPNTYTDNPQAAHTLAQDQPNIRANMSYLANTIGNSLSATKDHQISIGGVDTNVGEGRHLRVSFRDNGALTYPGDGTDAYLFSTGGNVFWGNSSLGATAQQLTRSNTGAGFGAATNGWTFLPGGLLLQYGTAVAYTHGSLITFPIAFTSAPFNIQITASYSSQSRGTWYSDISTITTTQFRAWTLDSSGSSIATTINWIAIGI